MSICYFEAEIGGVSSAIERGEQVPLRRARVQAHCRTRAGREAHGGGGGKHGGCIMKTSVQEICRRLRDRITEPRKKSTLVQESRPIYLQICACLDVIEDTEQAICHFCRDKQLGPLGDRYLEIFGVMQAMFAQQDAVTDLAKHLDGPCRTRQLFVRGVREERLGRQHERR